jgi:uncharacterized protein (DUF1684 family)
MEPEIKSKRSRRGRNIYLPHLFFANSYEYGEYLKVWQTPSTKRRLLMRLLFPYTFFTFWIVISILHLFACQTENRHAQAFYRAEEEWRQQREQRLQRADSWLTIAGLYWLEIGDNRLGTDLDNDIILPPGKAAAQVGNIHWQATGITFFPTDQADVRVSGRTESHGNLRHDQQSKTDTLYSGPLAMWLIKRGDRIGLRLRDSTSASRAQFKGLQFYPPDSNYIVFADYMPFHKKDTVIVPTVVGTEEKYIIPGRLQFDLDGTMYQLDPFAVKNDTSLLFIIFRDRTSEQGESYGAGRYMYARKRGGNEVQLNFNRAYNPPCAFTPYATCPLPPSQNVLDVAIRAGEKYEKKEM